MKNMRRAPVILVFAVAASCRATPPAAQATAMPKAEPWTAQGQTPEVRATNDRFVAEVMQRIKGHENEPSEKVFENVQWLKGIPARQFVGIMNGGYAAALGVTCAHCHVPSDFASDDKRPKRAARQMAVMHRSINTQMREMSELASQPAANRAISCSTCHRASINPLNPSIREMFQP
jgi:hypothetical protein